jgi:hypothetical protein
MGERINEEKILAILYSNFSGRGKQKDDWIFIAEKLNELKSVYGSDEKVAKNLGLSRETVRSTIKLICLPNEIKKLVRDGQISQDLGWRLLAIKNKKTQIQVAKAIIGLGAHDARDMIRYAKNNPDSPITNQITRLKKSRESMRKLNLVITTLTDAEYNQLQRLAKEKNKSINELISEIVKNWVKRNER